MARFALFLIAALPLVSSRMLQGSSSEYKAAVQEAAEAMRVPAQLLDGLTADLGSLEESLRAPRSLLQLSAEPKKVEQHSAKPAAAAAPKAAAPKKEELDTAKVVQQMAALSSNPAGMPAMSSLLEGMYDNWKEKIGSANKHEREQKKQFDATIAQLEAKKADAKKHGGTTETYDRIEKYWERQRSISHRQYHTALKIMHSGMEQFKSVKGAMDDAIKGKKPSAKDLRAVGLAQPDVVFLQEGVRTLRTWAKDASAALHDARELRADAI
mmetsp:Transcript_77390/g.167346  ORF Transcript_77390/g.167346 Transcript_77390/m.167346 type:complete len:269 (+) Transcript_77390:113-919(+)